MSPSKVANIDFTQFYNIVDGKPRGSKASHCGVDPTNGENLWAVPVATQQDVDDAVQAGQKAFLNWKTLPIAERKDYVTKFIDLYSQHEEELTDVLCKETGKPRMMANFEVKGGAFSLAAPVKLDLPEEREEDDQKIVITRFTPLGVVGAICPWNFPVVLAMIKVGSAIVAGNVIIVKPSPYTPYSMLKVVELAQEIFPPGVIQAVGGDDKIGPMLTAHPGIAKISFTGSIATGKKIMEACAKTLKRVTLELGGNDACVVLPDVDIEKVAPVVAMGAFMNSGQVCVASKRIYVPSSIYEPFLTAMVAATKKLLVGGPSDEGITHGPVQNKMQFEKVKELFADTKANGYKFAVGQTDFDATAKGYFVQPTIIDNPPTESRIVQEEPFGPIVPCQRYSTIDEAIALANATNTGLGACVFGKDVELAQSVGAQLEAGSVWINSVAKPNPMVFFSGHKESGMGGEMGRRGFEGFCNAHVMHVYKQVEKS